MSPFMLLLCHCHLKYAKGFDDSTSSSLVKKYLDYFICSALPKYLSKCQALVNWVAGYFMYIVTPVPTSSH